MLERSKNTINTSANVAQIHRGSKTIGNTTFSNLEAAKLKEIQHFRISRLPNARKCNIFEFRGVGTLGNATFSNVGVSKRKEM